MFSYHVLPRLTHRLISGGQKSLPTWLDVACKENKLQVIIEADVLIASQGSAFDVEYQIDKQAPVKIQLRTFPDSKRKGYTEEQAKQMGDALLSGQSVFIRVNTLIRRVLSGEMPLNDAVTPIKQVYADCGLTADNAHATDYSLVNFTDDFNKLSVEQQQQVLSKLKGIMAGCIPYTLARKFCLTKELLQLLQSKQASTGQASICH
jgi:hypothetical protein